MDCFLEGPNFLVIDPDGCIDCSVCVAECPVGAIVNASEATEAQLPFVELNARLARDPRWKPITRRQAPLPAHETWRGVTSKAHRILGATA